MAPASLIDKRITWESIDSTKAKAVFTNGTISITAILHFNKENQLIDFVSTDRYDVGSKQWIPFSTPVKAYQQLRGVNIIKYGEGVWQYPEGSFVYGKFNLKEVAYNLSALHN
jgi:hypothetical protein